MLGRGFQTCVNDSCHLKAFFIAHPTCEDLYGTRGPRHCLWVIFAPGQIVSVHAGQETYSWVRIDLVLLSRLPGQGLWTTS